jgi:ankyrin repeat protein
MYCAIAGIAGVAVVESCSAVAGEKSWNNLPDEIKIRIFNRLDEMTQKTASKVSKGFYELSKDREVLAPLIREFERTAFEEYQKHEFKFNYFFNQINFNEIVPFDRSQIERMNGPLRHPSLHRAARLGRLDLVREFLRKDPDALTVRNSYGYTPLHEAIRGGQKSQAVVEFFMNQLSRDEKMANPPNTPLVYFAAEYQSTPMLHFLTDELSEEDLLVDIRRVNALHFIAKDLRLMQLFAKKVRPENMNRPSPEGTTPLMLAVLSGNQDVVEFLLDRVVDQEISVLSPIDGVCIYFGVDYKNSLISIKKSNAFSAAWGWTERVSLGSAVHLAVYQPQIMKLFVNRLGSSAANLETFGRNFSPLDWAIVFLLISEPDEPSNDLLIDTIHILLASSTMDQPVQLKKRFWFVGGEKPDSTRTAGARI